MKRKTLLFLLLMALFAPLAMNAQSTYSWGSSSTNSGKDLAANPFGRHWGWEYRVYLYQPNMMYGVSGNITKLEFLPYESESSTGGQIDVWMKSVTDITSLSNSTTFATYKSGATLVYSSSSSPSFTSGTYVSLPLSSPVAYNYSNNEYLMILVRSVANSSSGDGGKNFYYYNPGNVSDIIWYKRQDGSDPGQDVSGSTGGYLPVIRVTYSNTPSYDATYTLNNNITQALTCGGHRYRFLDSGGVSDNYGNSQNYTATFSCTGGEITITFNSFAVESYNSDYDYLTLYDDETKIAKLGGNGGTISGDITTPTSYTATSGILKAVWKSDSSVQKAGWDATITTGACVSSYTVTTNVFPTAAGTVTGGGTISAGSTTTLTASANTGYTFHHWEKNGVQVSESPSYTTPAITANATYTAVYNVYSPFTETAGTSGTGSSEDPAKLVDNDITTKWCVTSLGNPTYIEFNYGSAFIPQGYSLTTGNDNAGNPGRNPKSWVIKAKRNSGDSWTTIATVTNDNILQDLNQVTYNYNISNTNAYQYFRFEISAIQSGGTMQLSELRFVGKADTSAPTTIASVADWNAFCTAVNNGHDYSGETVRMTADVTTAVSTMAGTSSHPFRGTFDGQGHTLNVAISSSEQGAAPFHYINGATITNLVVSGSVTASSHHASGLVGFASTDSPSYSNAPLNVYNTIYNCLVHTNVTNTYSSDNYIGGIVGHNRCVRTTIEGCVYDGALTSAGYKGGFIGWSDRSQVTINNSYFCGTNNGSGSFNPVGCKTQTQDGTNVTIDLTLSNFYHNYSGTIYTNVYAITYNTSYASSVGNMRVYSITAGTNVTVEMYGNATTYQYSGITAYSKGIKYNNVLYAGNGDEVRLNLGCTATGYQATYSADHGTLSGSSNPYTLTMTANNTTINATLVELPIRVSDGTWLSWEEFAAGPANGTTYSGKTVYLERDITTSVKVSGTTWTPGQAFRGTFDGQGHTITLDMNSTATQASLFNYTYGATIKNLNVDGTITSTGSRAAGFVAMAQGGITFENCISDVTISSTSVQNGGFVGDVINGATFRGCAFTGKLLGESSNDNGGFVGHYHYSGTSGGSRTYTNCVFAPSEVTMGTSGSYTFCRLPNTTDDFRTTITNCYYTEAFGTTQGKQAYSVTGVSPVTVARSGSASNTYDLSGIAAYSTGLNFTNDGTTIIYAGSGETIGLTLSGSDNYHANHGTLSGSGNAYNLTMEAYNTEISVGTHDISVEANPTAGGTVSGGGTYTHGATATLTATASNGYHFTSWMKNDVDVDNHPTYSPTVTGDATYTANFTQNDYRLTIYYLYQNGETAADPYIQDGLHYLDLYEVASPIIEGCTADYPTVSGTMPYDNRTVVVTYTINTYTIRVYTNDQTHSSVNLRVDGALVEGNSAIVNHGQTVTANATINGYYGVDSWTKGENGQAMSSDNPYVFQATESIDLWAHVSYWGVPPTVVTNTVTNITTTQADCSGEVTADGGSTVTERGFCWSTSSTPTIADAYVRLGEGTGAYATSGNNVIKPLTPNTKYYVRAYAKNRNGVAYGATREFTSLAEVTTAAATNVHTIDATLGGSWTSTSESITSCGVVYSSTNATPTLGGDDCLSQAASATSTPFTVTVTGLEDETMYYARAYVTNAGGTSYGAVVTFTTLPYYRVAAIPSPAEGGTISFSPKGDGSGGDATTVKVGEGSETTAFLPFTSPQSYSFNQMIYLASEIGKQGTIKSITFFKEKKTVNPLNYEIEIYMKNVSRSSYSANNEWESIGADDLCFSGSLVAPAKGTDAPVTITLTKAFEYDGTSNLLVAFNEKTPGTNGAVYWYSTNTTNNTCIVRINGADALTPATASAMNGTCLNARPNVEFSIVAASSGTEWYSYGSTTTLTATPNEGYVFSHWTENNVNVGTNAEYTLSNITDEHELTAHFVDCKRFVSDGNWNDGSKWEPAGVPDEHINVAIEANATVPSGVVAKAKDIVRINEGASLTIADGGQLWHSNTGVNVTIKKNVNGYGEDYLQTNMGYTMLSMPVTTSHSGIVTESPYDWYYFDYDNVEEGELLEWVHETAPTFMRGYIYANQHDTEISVTGTATPSATPYEGEELAFSSDYRFNGWNLVGNPFVCNAYVTRSSNEINYYVLNHNNAGYDEFILASSLDAIAPMEGLMVQATATGQNITYSRTAPNEGTGILNIDVNRAMERGNAMLDRARVRFGEGTNLGKLQFNTRHTKVYIPEDGNDYAVYYSQGSGTIPVNFKAEDNGRYTLSFSTENVGFNYLHLIDNMNGSDVDLLQTPYYAFDAKSTDYASRFTLVFATGDDNDDTFAFYNNGVWIINNPSESKAVLQVVDVLGHILSSETISGSCSKAINAASGVYMFRLINGNDVKVQKVVVKR